MQIIASIGRAVWRNDIALFGKCNADWTFICTCVHLAPISGLTGTSYKVTIFDEDTFEAKYAELRILFLNKELADLETNRKKKNCNRVSRRRAIILEWLKTWAPFGRTVHVQKLIFFPRRYPSRGCRGHSRHLGSIFARNLSVFRCQH